MAAGEGAEGRIIGAMKEHRVSGVENVSREFPVVQCPGQQVARVDKMNLDGKRLRSRKEYRL